eukprot:TRINITY_DN57974_c0_g1_i1.p1 TRINITY_DN57974_c0_g1~~TRINITY_DN57974_c0_g1_i1.p1  ORF type:complete len:147 (-),score=37.16 TRINITY_DN57974_c0_g1_i1:254-694(-)
MPPKSKIEILADLGLTSFKAGDNEKAIGFFEQGLALNDTQPAPTSCLVTLLMNLAVAKGVAGDMAAAAPLLERALAAQEAELGADHNELLEPLQNLIVVHMKLGNTEKAAGYMQRAGEIENKFKNNLSQSVKNTEEPEERCVEVES